MARTEMAEPLVTQGGRAARYWCCYCELPIRFQSMAWSARSSDRW
jgi:hypothetical protein